MCRDRDLPARRAWYLYVQRYPDLAAREQEIHFGLPYRVQLKHRKVSPQFFEDCKRLKSQGKTQAAIGKELGVEHMSVWTALAGKAPYVSDVQLMLPKLKSA